MVLRMLDSDFTVFDRDAAMRELDARDGLKVRLDGGWVYLNRAALAGLDEVGGGMVHRGVLLVVDVAGARAGVAIAPPDCAGGQRQELVRRASVSEAAWRTAGHGPELTAGWPAAVRAHEFMALHEPAEGVQAAVLDCGVLVFSTAKVQGC